eukprot:1152834-Pelagomonas_calceolata.AAC.2
MSAIGCGATQTVGSFLNANSDLFLKRLLKPDHPSLKICTQSVCMWFTKSCACHVQKVQYNAELATRGMEERKEGKGYTAKPIYEAPVRAALKEQLHFEKGYEVMMGFALQPVNQAAQPAYCASHAEIIHESGNTMPSFTYLLLHRDRDT